MKRDWAMVSGWIAGVFAVATLLLLIVFVWAAGTPQQARLLWEILQGVILFAGPGLLLLSLSLTSGLRRLREARTRGAVLGLGTIVGAFLGLPACMLVPMLFFGRDILQTIAEPLQPDVLAMLATGVLGGATTGFTCAWRLTAAPKEPA
jgi:hypothetical protein